MRIRILQKPTLASIDGLRLDHFYPGFQYIVGNVVGSLLLAQGWAEPVSDDEPALLIPFSDTRPSPHAASGEPPNLVRERYPRDLDDVSVAADTDRTNQ